MLLKFFLFPILVFLLTSCQVLLKPPLTKEELFPATSPNIEVFVYPRDIKSVCTVTRARPYYVYRPRDYSRHPLNVPPYIPSTYTFYSNK